MRALCLIATFTLIACNQQEAGPVDSEVSPVSGADDEQTLPGERSLADETRTGPTHAAQQLPGIPAPFIGTWDYAEGDCMASSDLRMEIEPQRVTFYESVGEVIEVNPVDGDSVVVELDMEGEGETWRDTMRLALSEDGETLLPSDTEDDPGDAMPRQRCEG